MVDYLNVSKDVPKIDLTSSEEKQEKISWRMLVTDYICKVSVKINEQVNWDRENFDIYDDCAIFAISVDDKSIV